MRFTPPRSRRPAATTVASPGTTTQTWVQERADWTCFPVVDDGRRRSHRRRQHLVLLPLRRHRQGGHVLPPRLLAAGRRRQRHHPEQLVHPGVTVLDSAGTMTARPTGSSSTTVSRQRRRTASALTRRRATPPRPSGRCPAPPTLRPRCRSSSLLTSDRHERHGRRLRPRRAGRLRLRRTPAEHDLADGGTGFTGSLADINVALGAAETTPPTAPGVVSAASRNAGAVVSWGAATDDTAVTSYHVYRWTDAPLGGGYTPLLLKVATVTDGTSYTDSGLANGTTYHYLVRAVDAATNVGPRSRPPTSLLQPRRPRRSR